MWFRFNRLGSRFRFNETSQILERYSVERKAAMKQKRLVMLGQMYLLTIEYPKHDWHSAFGHKRVCYSRAMLETYILNLLYRQHPRLKYVSCSFHAHFMGKTDRFRLVNLKLHLAADSPHFFLFFGWMLSIKHRHLHSKRSQQMELPFCLKRTKQNRV